MKNINELKTEGKADTQPAKMPSLFKLYLLIYTGNVLINVFVVAKMTILQYFVKSIFGHRISENGCAQYRVCKPIFIFF